VYIVKIILFSYYYFIVPYLCTPTLIVVTLALGSQPRQRACKGVSQEEAQESKQEEETWESHHKFPGVLESVREYEGVNLHTPKATPTLGDGVPLDSKNFKERSQGSKPNGL
jgi:hypothetical protein